MFLNRDDAGQKLAEALASYRRKSGGLVLALPRGGAVVGSALSASLDLPLDVFVSLKLRLPDQPESAWGAVTETGHVFVNREVKGAVLPASCCIEHETHSRKLEVDWRRMLYRGGRPLPSLKDRTVILVDDGVDTGATILAAAESLKALGSMRLVAAVPVGSLSAMATLENLVHDLVVLEAPKDLVSIGAYYQNFDPVADAVVLRRLAFRHGVAGAHRRVGPVAAL